MIRFQLIFIVLLCVASAITAQNLNVSVGKPVFYKNVKNPVNISLNGYKSKDLIVKVDGGKFIREEDKTYIIPFDSIHELKIKVGIKTKTGVKWLDSGEYWLRKFPKEQTLFGTHSGGLISKGELHVVCCINAGFGDGFAMSHMLYTIKSYRILILGETMMYSAKVEGRRLPDQVRRILESLKGGEFIYIYDVNASVHFRDLDYRTEESTLPVSLSVKYDTTDWNKAYPEFNLKGISEYPILINTRNIQGIDWKMKDISSMNGRWELGKNICGTEVILLSQNYKNDTLLNATGYYPSGKIKFVKTSATKTSDGRYTAYYENGQIMATGALKAGDDYYYDLDTDIPENQNDTLKNHLMKINNFINIAEPITGLWKFYYPSGHMMASGNFTFISDTRKLPRYNYDDPYAEHPDQGKILRDGEWMFFDENGQKMIVNYNKGRIVKE
jgi:antitoxin component YwqK of YwqJK toxin-antitoxin module